jgi:hypothetical protein
MRAAALVENLGIPAVSIVSSGFLRQAELVARGLSAPLAIAEYPGHPMGDSAGELQRKVEHAVAPRLLRALTREAALPEEHEPEPAPGQVVFRGGFDEVQAYFHSRLWTDGLPIVPPTRERVESFLACTARPGDESLAVVPQEGRHATIASIAVNGVMAGCRPEYMPVLIATVEAMCAPEFRLEDCGATPGWEPMVVVNGPIVKALDFNYGQGVMRFGRRANTSIGRFVRLFLRNICGYRISPGAGDKASIGQSVMVALAEDEDRARAFGWPTYAEDRGFGSDESVVTVQSVVAATPPIYSTGDHAVDHVREWADIMGQSFSSWVHTDFRAGVGNYLIVAGPLVAKVVAREWTKDEVRRYIRDRVRISAARAKHHADMLGVQFSFEKLVSEGILPAEYAASDDPERLVRMFIRPESLQIVEAGDPERNQSRAYMTNHNQGPPVSRRVELPPSKCLPRPSADS